MVQTPSISVIMICYNQEKFIREAIQSILDQTIYNYELIIVDDGSTDKTAERIFEFDDDRIVPLFQENSGPSVAINSGIHRSKGEYLALMSGDDVAIPHRFETQLSQIEENNSDIVFSIPEIIGPNSEELRDEACTWFFGNEFEDHTELLHMLFFEQNFLCAPTFFGRKSAIDEIGEFKRGLVQLQDYEYWIRACKKEKGIKLFQEPILKYRYLFGANLSSTINVNRMQIEKNKIYREFFTDLSDDLFLKTFKADISQGTQNNIYDREIDKSFLYIKHTDEEIKKIGIELLISQFGNDALFDHLSTDRDFHFPDLLNLYENLSDSHRKTFGGMFEATRRGLPNFLLIGAGESITKGSRKFPLGVSLMIFLRKHIILIKIKIIYFVSKINELFGNK